MIIVGIHVVIIFVTFGRREADLRWLVTVNKARGHPNASNSSDVLRSTERKKACLKKHIFGHSLFISLLVMLS